MTKALLRVAASATVLLALSYALPGLTVSDVPTALLAALAVGVVNAVLGPIFRLLALPVRVLTLGLFSLVINAVLFGIAIWLVPGFGADGLTTVFVGALLFGLGSWALQSLIGARRN